MAFDIFITIPNIPGESISQRFPNAIEVQSYSWGLSEAVSSTGSGQGAGKPQLSDFSFQKLFDKSSPLLMQALVTGEHLAKITVSLVQAGGKTLPPFLTYEFDKVLITSIQDAGSTGGDSRPSESISFAGQKVIVTYRPQDPKTGNLGTPIIFTYDSQKPA